MHTVKTWKGYIYMLLAACLFATGGLALKYVNYNPLAINAMRSVLGAGVVGLFAWSSHHPLKMNRTILFGSFSYMMVTTLFIIANKLTTAANAIVLQFTAPIWIVILSFVLWHKKPALYELLTLAGTGAGILCFFYASFYGEGILGDVAAIVSGIFYGILFMLNSMKGGDALSSVFYGQIFSALLFSPFVFQIHNWSLSQLAAVAWLGTFQVGAAYVFFSLGTALVPPLQASLINGLEPVLNPILVAVFFHETLSPLSLIGAVLVIVSILAGSIYGLAHPSSST